MARVSPQLICFSYHKSGTSLLLHVMTKISARLGLSLANHYGLVDHLDPGPDIVLLPHSILRASLDRPYRAIRMIRDPRDIWVSGYLYHRRCVEEWCVNTDLDPTPPILWPRVDHSVAHWPEDWKRGYIERLNGRSYQQNLLERTRQDGLDFELAGYTGWTLKTMQDWPSNRADAMDVKLEHVMADFDAAMLRIFSHFGFTAEQTQAALDVARSEDVRRMDEASIAERPQITSRTISKWRDVLSPAQIAQFEEHNGDLIRQLGYEPTTDAGFSLNRDPRNDLTTPDADITLWADGITIRPTVAKQGVYAFVVPPGRSSVRLTSRRGPRIEQDRTHRPHAGCFGLKVHEIAIRAGARDIVIAADDPRLTNGWYAAEHAGAAVWRWTNGSAELPWPHINGAVMLTIRCDQLPEYPIVTASEQPLVEGPL